MLSKDPTLFFSDSATFGDSLKRHIMYASALLSKHPGSEIRIISYAPKSWKVKSGEVADGLRIYGTASLSRATYLAGILRLLPVALADDWRPDVVTVQTPWEEGTVGYFIAKTFNARFLPQLHFDLFSEEWKKEHWLNPWRRMIASWLLRHADTIRVVSNVQREKLVSRLGIGAAKIKVVPVGVNFQPVTGLKEKFKNKIARGLETKKVVLFVGRFCHQKNLPLWVDVAEHVSRQIPEVAFVMAGDGETSDMVRSIVRKRGFEDRFHFLGTVGHEQLPEVYAAADIFLLTSHYEGFGRVIVESYLSGVPVVSTACTGPEDLIVSGETGFLLACNDCRGLTDAVVQLLKDDERRECFGLVGCEKISRSFSLEALTSKLIECWDNS